MFGDQLNGLRTSWMGSFGMGWHGLGHSFQKIYDMPCPNWCFYQSKGPYNCLGTSWMGWGPVEWVGVSGCDVTRPKWPKNNISFSSTFSFDNSKWQIFVKYVFLWASPKFQQHGLTAVIGRIRNNQLFKWDRLWYTSCVMSAFAPLALGSGRACCIQNWWKLIKN